MDYVQAHAILSKFAQAYRAAEFMADALELAASLERRSMELTNNVEHLRKEQNAQQTSLDAMQAGFVQARDQMQQQHGERLAALRQEAATLQARLASERAVAEQAVTEARARAEADGARAQQTIAELDGQITDKREAVLALDKQIEALRAQARLVLN